MLSIKSASIFGSEQSRNAVVSTDHDGEDALLHFPSIFRTQDDHLHALEVDLDRGSTAHTLGKAVGRELARVVNDKVGFAKICQLFFRRADQHVVLNDHP
jgi:hypothetical protein